MAWASSSSAAGLYREVNCDTLVFYTLHYTVDSISFLFSVVFAQTNGNQTLPHPENGREKARNIQYMHEM